MFDVGLFQAAILEMAVVDAINKAESVFAETYKQASGRELGEEV